MRVGILPQMFANAQDGDTRDLGLHEMSKCFVEMAGLLEVADLFLNSFIIFQRYGLLFNSVKIVIFYFTIGYI